MGRDRRGRDRRRDQIGRALARPPRPANTRDIKHHADHASTRKPNPTSNGPKRHAKSSQSTRQSKKDGLPRRAGSGDSKDALERLLKKRMKKLFAGDDVMEVTVKITKDGAESAMKLRRKLLDSVEGDGEDKQATGKLKFVFERESVSSEAATSPESPPDGEQPPNHYRRHAPQPHTSDAAMLLPTCDVIQETQLSQYECVPNVSDMPTKPATDALLEIPDSQVSLEPPDDEHGDSSRQYSEQGTQTTPKPTRTIAVQASPVLGHEWRPVSASRPTERTHKPPQAKNYSMQHSISPQRYSSPTLPPQHAPSLLPTPRSSAIRKPNDKAPPKRKMSYDPYDLDLISPPTKKAGLRDARPFVMEPVITRPMEDIDSSPPEPAKKANPTAGAQSVVADSRMPTNAELEAVFFDEDPDFDQFISSSPNNPCVSPSVGAAVTRGGGENAGPTTDLVDEDWGELSDDNFTSTPLPAYEEGAPALRIPPRPGLISQKRSVKEASARNPIQNTDTPRVPVGTSWGLKTGQFMTPSNRQGSSPPSLTSGSSFPSASTAMPSSSPTRGFLGGRVVNKSNFWADRATSGPGSGQRATTRASTTPASSGSQVWKNSSQHYLSQKSSQRPRKALREVTNVYQFLLRSPEPERQAKSTIAHKKPSPQVPPSPVPERQPRPTAGHNKPPPQALKMKHAAEEQPATVCGARPASTTKAPAPLPNMPAAASASASASKSCTPVPAPRPWLLAKQAASARASKVPATKVERSKAKTVPAESVAVPKKVSPVPLPPHIVAMMAARSAGSG